MQNLLDDLKGLLQQDERLVVDGKLLKNKIIELALQLDPNLLKMLLSHDSIKKHFFKDVEGILVFDKIKFQKFVSNKAFLPDSYTSFKNRIGLIDDDEFIKENKDVVLAWPYKDCVLEGGQTKDDQKRKEIFWNTLLAPDEIDRLLAPKVLTNFKKFDTNGISDAQQIDSSSNLIIKGNNLLTLYSLKHKFSGKIKLIYIDPPYNTGGDSFQYNDSFNHSSWLTFIKNRLEVAKELLADNGSIWVNIDDDESHYLKVLMDEIFGRENFVANVVWKKKYSPQNDARYFSDMHDHILVYGKNKDVLKLNLIPRTEAANKRYKNSDKDPRGPWKSSDLSVKTYSAKNDYPISTAAGKVVNPPKSTCWRYSKEKYEELVRDNRIYFGVNGDAAPSIKRFLSEVQQGTPPQTIWDYSEVGHTQDARKEILALLDDADFATPKPERLLQRIIHISTNENDIVLDFFAGSGTTGAVAMKMKRRFITCEQMDYIDTVTVPRIKKVIEGEQGGVSVDVNWSGGSSFIYMELMKANQLFIEQIERASTTESLLEIWQKIINEGFINYFIEPSTLNSHLDNFSKLSLEEQKSLLIEMMDKNQLYVNLSEISDEDFKIDKETINLNNQFYNG